MRLHAATRHGIVELYTPLHKRTLHKVQVFNGVISDIVDHLREHSKALKGTPQEPMCPVTLSLHNHIGTA
jgi:hypothetical protein